MSSVIFIRHGESLANVDSSYYQQHDSAVILTKKGVDQSLALQKEIDNIMDQDFYGLYTTVIASRFQRAKITAQIVMANHQQFEIHTDPRLNETYHSAHEVVAESPNQVIARVHSLVKQHHTNLILFCHGMLMGTIDPAKGNALNCEWRKYDRLKLLSNLENRIT